MGICTPINYKSLCVFFAVFEGGAARSAKKNVLKRGVEPRTKKEETNAESNRGPFASEQDVSWTKKEEMYTNAESNRGPFASAQDVSFIEVKGKEM